MYLPDYTIQVLHQNRLHEAAEKRALLNLIRDTADQMPDAQHVGRFSQLRERLHHRSQPRASATVHHAPAA